MYPATEKEVIRNHISYICRKQHCVDSLVLYLNSPTRNDGTMLLWDRNNNGIVSVCLFSRSDGCVYNVCKAQLPESTTNYFTTGISIFFFLNKSYKNYK